MKLAHCTLENDQVRLEPLGHQHAEALIKVINDGELWKLFVTTVPSPEDIPTFIDRAMAEFERGESLAFATIDKASGQLAGSTRFMKIAHIHQRAEIGFTFLGEQWQRSFINTNAKYLMLSHAFECWGLNRVELLTDFLNTRSRRAIERLGAHQEGVLRSHMVMRDGRLRDSVIFSITRQDWPGVKQNLQHLLQQHV